MANPELLVIGHRNPDTDAICSALGYADYKRRTGAPHAVAARCGDINDRIDFVLQTFGVAAPRLVTDVSPRIRDVMQRNLVSVSRRATLVEAMGLMDDHGIRVLPILDADGQCQGLVSVFKMNKFFCALPERPSASHKVLTSVANLARTLRAEVVTSRDPEPEQDLGLVVGAMDLPTFARRVAGPAPDSLLVIVGDRRDIQEAAIAAQVRILIVAGGIGVDPVLVELATARGVSILLSPYDTPTTAMLCRGAVTVEHIVHEHFVSFHEDDLLTETEPVAASSPYHVFPVLDAQSRMIGILAKSDFLKPAGRQLILVDHNEFSQAVTGADQVEIVEIIDHHRLGALSTSHPILVRNEPVGSTSTIVADCFLRDCIPLSKSIAGLLLAGLVSDTLNLTSPTTTPRDAQVLKALEGIAEVRAREFTERLFASGSILNSLPADQVLLADCKEFEDQNRKFSLAQIEELGFDQFWKRKKELATALEQYRQSRDYWFSALLVTDIVRKTSLLLITGDRALLKAIDYPEVEPGTHELAGVVSRKKQLLPYFLQLNKRGGARPAPASAEPLTMV